MRFQVKKGPAYLDPQFEIWDTENGWIAETFPFSETEGNADEVLERDKFRAQALNQRDRR